MIGLFFHAAHLVVHVTVPWLDILMHIGMCLVFLPKGKLQ